MAPGPPTKIRNLHSDPPTFSQCSFVFFFHLVEIPTSKAGDAQRSPVSLPSSPPQTSHNPHCTPPDRPKPALIDLMDHPQRVDAEKFITFTSTTTESGNAISPMASLCPVGLRNSVRHGACRHWCHDATDRPEYPKSQPPAPPHTGSIRFDYLTSSSRDSRGKVPFCPRACEAVHVELVFASLSRSRTLDRSIRTTKYE